MVCTAVGSHQARREANTAICARGLLGSVSSCVRYNTRRPTLERYSKRETAEGATAGPPQQFSRWRAWHTLLIFDTLATVSTTLPGISFRSCASVIIVLSSTSHSSPAATPGASTPKSASVRATAQQCACASLGSCQQVSTSTLHTTGLGCPVRRAGPHPTRSLLCVPKCEHAC